MKNIYQTWNKYSEDMGRPQNGASANRWFNLAEDNSKLWGNQDYPVGEDWKYVRFNQLPKTNFSLAGSKNSDQLSVDSDFYTLNVQDFSGQHTLDVSALPEGLEIINRAEELRSNPESPLLGLYQETSRDNLFAQSALSFAEAGLVVRIAAGAKIDRPLKLVIDLNQIDLKEALVVYNIFVDCAPKSHLPIFVEVVGHDFSGLFNLRMDFSLAEESFCSYCAKELGGVDSHMVSSVSTQVQKSARFESFDFSLPGQWSRHNLRVDLREEGATCKLRGGYLNNKSYFSDHHTEMNHWVGNTDSDEDYRGILSDSAKAVFNGKVFIENKAARSNSNQINKNLMLSKKADINTKPELKIYNDDVKAAHGATVGQLDEEQRFYLQSRGYSDDRASNVLAKAFIFDLIEEEAPAVKKFYADDLTQAISQLKED